MRYAQIKNKKKGHSVPASSKNQVLFIAYNTRIFENYLIFSSKLQVELTTFNSHNITSNRVNFRLLLWFYFNVSFYLSLNIIAEEMPKYYDNNNYYTHYTLITVTIIINNNKY